MLVVSVPLAAVLVVFGLRWIPGRWQGPLPVRKPEHARTPWWAVAGVLAVAAGFGADQLIYHSQFIIILRDPASYIQFASWIAHHGSLPIPQDRAAFGGAHPGLRFDSYAFYQVGNTVVPQFMAGLPMILAGGFWIGGVPAAVAMAPLLGALRGAHLRRPGRPPRRAAVGAAGGPDPGDFAAGAVHQPVDLQRAGGADPVPRRALPGHRLASVQTGSAPGSPRRWAASPSA